MHEFKIEDAMRLANLLHAGQLDKAGRPYLGHLERVASRVRHSGGNWAQEMAAWLHDSVEDTDATTYTLLSHGVPTVVVSIVEAMTHRDGVTNEDYWDAIASDSLARLVKLCDIYDNLDPERMCYLDAATQTRLRRKYARAMQVLA